MCALPRLLRRPPQYPGGVAPRRAGFVRSLGRDDAGMADLIAPAPRQFRQGARRHAGLLPLRKGGEGMPSCTVVPWRPMCGLSTASSGDSTGRPEVHTSELLSLMRISYAVS